MAHVLGGSGWVAIDSENTARPNEVQRRYDEKGTQLLEADARACAADTMGAHGDSTTFTLAGKGHILPIRADLLDLLQQAGRRFGSFGVSYNQDSISDLVGGDLQGWKWSG